MSTPLFSIVTIAYQNKNGLLETVESVKSQTFRDFEHIVIDAGSTDGSAEWLAANFDGAWVSERDRGRYHGMNKGAQMARGEYLWFMHSGDVFGDEDVLKRVAAAIADAGHPDWLYGLARVVGADKSLHSVLALVPFSMFNVAILGRSLPHQAAAFKRDFFWRLGGYDETMPVAADLLFMVRAGDCSPPLVLADFVCNFDYTGISATRSWRAIHWDEYQIRRRSGVRVTRSRVLDNVLAVTYALIQLAGLSLRGMLGRKDATANPSNEIGG
ncbi:glycosyltransferase family 2 protein [Mycolicibacterium helvum]|uniref:Putative glycosyltransferase n=1 Tax=Mycolicibacterium helvum TaxID=1534349 RepID=A0A7I7T4D3_9MYCO|nr:glycosyltransferase family 2 protein [Mycolicibacterium helvum]BBY63361.1 putative glycosyltransferase [Mycolicibacterium helvum]